MNPRPQPPSINQPQQSTGCTPTETTELPPPTSTPTSAYFGAGTRTPPSFSWVDESSSSSRGRIRIRPFFETVNYWGDPEEADEECSGRRLRVPRGPCSTTDGADYGGDGPVRLVPVRLFREARFSVTEASD
ncbi:uncharacterized protein A4U43_C07F33840 [Asparagus officinalis]|uniref:Uncharacterized protein n=1 Tax=Asparagus officinalis TaxID=4686 RepID=A0A5P1EGU2_ASPOF|nr:uncharacterized protein A4U43_C07F33840 [Asparagus officinalis]